MRGLCRCTLLAVLVLSTLLAACASVMPRKKNPEAAPMDPPPFRELQELSSQNGTLALDLKLGYTDAKIDRDKVRLRTYNGDLVGPTLVAKPGDTLRVRLENTLPCPEGRVCTCKPDPCAGGEESPAAHAEHAASHVPSKSVFNTTNLHTHGLHVSPKCNSDNVFVQVEPGCGFSFEFKIPENHPAGTFWYHPHVHGSTAVQVSSGAAGALIIRGAFDEVPGIQGTGEDVFLFQQIPYKCNYASARDWTCKPDQVGTVEDFSQQLDFLKWQESGRFTTINGLVQPVIKMRPDEVRRWRFIHGGIRERLKVAVGEKTDKGGFQAQKGWFNLIALDGLAIGDVKAVDSLRLDPGYRADVLVRAPQKPGTYYLLDEPSAPLLSSLLDTVRAIKGTKAESVEPRKVLAVVVIEGNPCSDPQDPCHNTLPDPASLKAFRLPSITDEEIAGREPQKVYFDITGKKYKVCGRVYTPEAPPRSLELGKADEWIVASSSIAGHPFHIHVNPFEVIEPSGERYWKDTLFVDRGTTVRVRMRYDERFDGDAVLHCHILDHEDQGMMEAVRFAPGPQPVEQCTIP